ncbi:hypothetical protein SAMN03159343_0089 [Klenkia marina]|uniref:Uncharacterized protein n=1 Tax=Klenkia marina TaxID=1960309 RepID=A0A1G4X9M8_9ACTN|nr:hypothetical protein SAMN03159343_0089 [Klenkia marina]
MGNATRLEVKSTRSVWFPRRVRTQELTRRRVVDFALVCTSACLR